MFDVPIIEVAMGLVFAYVLLGLLCTILNEWISRFFSLRSNNLKSGLKQLLADPKMTGLARDVLNHHLIKGSASDQTKLKQSYIASETFARVLIDIIDKKSKGAVKTAKTITGIKSALNKAKLSEEVKSAITGLIDSTHTTIDDLRKNLQHWFDGSMERISGWYKRKLQVVSIIFALLLTIGFNVDTIFIGQALWKNPTLRAQIADEAAMAVEACKDKTAECSFPNKTATAREELMRFPIGWTAIDNSSPKDGKWFFLKIIGLLTTALAVSLGALFWFNMLDKLNSIRSAGIKPKAVTEKLK